MILFSAIFDIVFDVEWLLWAAMSTGIAVIEAIASSKAVFLIFIVVGIIMIDKY